MKDVLTKDIPMVNINQHTDKEILKNPLLAILNGLLKHGKKSRLESYHGLDLFFPRLLEVIRQIEIFWAIYKAEFEIAKNDKKSRDKVLEITQERRRKKIINILNRTVLYLNK